MNYLINYGFDQIEIRDFEALNADFLIEKISEFQEIVSSNMQFLQSLGVVNYKEIFKKHAEMFLMNEEEFQKIFLKYDREDLIAKLKNNPDLVEQL